MIVVNGLHLYLLYLCVYLFIRYPITTGTSVLGVCFNGGVAVAADTLGTKLLFCFVCFLFVKLMSGLEVNTRKMRVAFASCEQKKYPLTNICK